MNNIIINELSINVRSCIIIIIDGVRMRMNWTRKMQVANVNVRRSHKRGVIYTIRGCCIIIIIRGNN